MKTKKKDFDIIYIDRYKKKERGDIYLSKSMLREWDKYQKELCMMDKTRKSNSWKEN